MAWSALGVVWFDMTWSGLGLNWYGLGRPGEEETWGAWNLVWGRGNLGKPGMILRRPGGSLGPTGEPQKWTPRQVAENAIFKQETHKESVSKNRAWVFQEI